MVKAEWLAHGCLNVGDLPNDRRPAIGLRDRLSDIYGGLPFRVRDWPQRGFRHTLWWSEQSVRLRYGSAYMLKVDQRRGAGLYVGINVEKGLEDRDAAQRLAQQRKEPVSQFLLTRSWDWHRALGSLPVVGAAIQEASATLGHSLFCWVEFGRGDDGDHFLVTPDALYVRGGFKPVQWESVVKCASRPHPRQWGRLAVMRAFSLDECTPALDDSAVLEVFLALRSVRDIWRGIPSPPRRQGRTSPRWRDS